MIVGLKFSSTLTLLIALCLSGSWAFAQPPGVEPSDVELPSEPTAMIANVDGVPILLRDVAETVDNNIQQIIASSGRQPSPEELKMARTALIRRELRKEIQGKMMYRAFVRKMTGTQPQDKRAEMELSITSNVRKMFYEQQVPKLLEQYQLETVSDADAELRKHGSSLEQQERRFVESILGQEFIRGEMEKDPEIPLPDMKFYYEQNTEKFSRNARARWEQLTALFSRFETKQEARDAIIRMGNEAYYGGNVQAVAKRLSQEPLADETSGLHDWTNKGSLASDVLDQQIFSLPVNKLSQIIEDDNGFHIIRVLEREEAGMLSFADAQEEIRKILKDNMQQEQQKNLITDLERKIPVWTIFPEDVPKSKPLENAAVASATTQSLR
ncbi:peptidylprolyl isomerase [Rosistilla carotiformis]|uniref:Periplasmic chaperone PpiD n=2 Tax=Rosistilla carotiformis TaxID=2528017 RepID=A0A518JPW2_9BACT|nr:peptidylprolyl isomerase [Rosistilla carotiformis]